MNIPPEFQDTKYYFAKLSGAFAAHEEWLKSLETLPMKDVAVMADHLIEIASRQAHLADETAHRFMELFPQPPHGTEPEGWKELRARLQDQSMSARDLFCSAMRLNEYVQAHS